MNSNVLEVVKARSKFCDMEHDTIVIDGVPLDEMIQRCCPDEYLIGLIPMIMNWITLPGEQELIRSRFQSTANPEVLPVLMCPDDCDLWCTVIVAEVTRDGEHIYWSRLGYDRSTHEMLIAGYDCIGVQVRWLDKIPPLRFAKEVYYAELGKIYA